MAYLWVLRADPLYFSHVQVHWNRHLALPWVSVGDAFRRSRTPRTRRTSRTQSLELAFTALMIAVLIGGWNRLRPSYIAYMALSILIPMSHLQPHVDAALCARTLPDVCHFGALGRAPVGQQPHPRVLAPAARAFHRALRRLVLGCLTSHRALGAEFASSSSSVSSAPPAFVVNLAAFTLLQRLVPNHSRPLEYNLIYSGRVSGRRRLQLLPQPDLDVPLDGSRDLRGRAVPQRFDRRARGRFGRFGDRQSVAGPRAQDLVRRHRIAECSSTSS